MDSLGFEFSHPEVAFVPALGLRTYLPEALAGETTYVLHFGSLEEAVALWSGPANTGQPIDVTVAMGPAYASALASVSFTGVNQARAVQALLGYMSSQLGQDVNTLIPSGGPGVSTPRE